MNKTMVSFLRMAAFALALGAFMTVSAFATVPNACDSLTARDMGNGSVWLAWQYYGSPSPTSYRVYVADGQTTTLSDFSMYAEVRDTAPNTFWHEYLVSRLSSGSHTFYVTAVNSDGEGARSNFAYSISSETVRFTTTPPSGVVAVGDTYYYDANATSTGSGTVSYRLTKAPSGMTVDASTGEVSWTANASGYQIIRLEAYVANSPGAVASQQWTLQVYGCQTPATISGLVLYANGDTVRSGYVSVVGGNGNGVDTNRGVGTSQIDAHGHYSITLYDPGDYYLIANGPNFSNVYYGASGAQGAVAVHVDCGDNATANFSVEPSTYTVSGTVTSASSGSALSAIEIIARSTSGTASGYPAYHAWTNSSGQYSIKVPKNVSYIVSANPTFSQGYFQQIYDNVAVAANATSVDVGTADVSNIDFALVARGTYSNSLSGTLTDSAGNMLWGQVTLYQITSAGGSLEFDAPRSVQTDSGSANFSFSNLAPGTYVVYGVGYYGLNGIRGMYAPGYYVSNGLATAAWSDATVITVGSSSTVTGIDVKLHQLSGNGVARLRGSVNLGGGHTRKSDISTQATKPGADVLVSAIDASNNVAAYAMTDENGQYELTGLSQGAYIIVADKIYYSPRKTAVNVTSDGVTSAGDVTLTPQGASSVSQPRVSTGAEMNLSLAPNPTSSRMGVAFTAKRGSATITLIDALGRPALSKTIETSAGEVRCDLDAESLPAGAYLLRIDNAGDVASATVRIVR